MVDDLVLALQRLVDRFARWVRLGPPAEILPRRFLIIQIDGLSNQVFEKALATRMIPNTARLIKSRRFERRPMSVGLPSSLRPSRRRPCTGSSRTFRASTTTTS